jgi:hypothetical protein
VIQILIHRVHQPFKSPGILEKTDRQQFVRRADLFPAFAANWDRRAVVRQQRRTEFQANSAAEFMPGDVRPTLPAIVFPRASIVIISAASHNESFIIVFRLGSLVDNQIT